MTRDDVVRMWEKANGWSIELINRGGAVVKIYWAKEI
jgi:hypothetical protein